MFSNRKKIKIQGKTKAHKEAMVRSQVIELIRNGRIKTTPKKAKLLKSRFDKLVTKAKKGTPHSKSQVSSFFGSSNERSVERMYYIVDKFLGDRVSGYTSVVKTLPRKGDNADQVYISIMNFEKKEKKSRIQSALERQNSKGKKKDDKKDEKPKKKLATKKTSTAKKTETKKATPKKTTKSTK